MKIVRFLLRAAPSLTLLTALVSLLSGAFNGGLVVVVHRALTGAGEDGLPLGLGAAFVAMGVGKLATGYFSEVMLTRSAQQALAGLRLGLVRRLLDVPYRQFEQLGRGRVLSTLTDDVGTLNQALYTLPAFAINVTVVFGAATYLVYLSFYTLLYLAAFTLLGALVYRLVLRRAYQSFTRARGERDRLHEHFVSLVQGMKELKLHRPRREAYAEGEVQRTTSALMRLDVDSHARFIFAHIVSHAFLFALIGLVVFVLPTTLSISDETVSGYVLTALYLMGPLSGAAGALPVFSQASVSLERLERLGLSLEEQGREPREAVHCEHAGFERIEARDVVCAYQAESDVDRFVLGPLSFELRPGEIVFITGSNGSGKSTLARLITGLYHPDEGQLWWDGEEVDDGNRDAYRQLFSTVFVDFHLFETLLGLDHPELDSRAARYLRALGLERKVSVEGGTLSTVDLSQGQRKRLALLTAYLEDRPIYLFDEWAADQDPSFKRVFYEELLPELKAAGKAVVVVTHDDRYFHLADRRFDMHEGRLQQVVGESPR